MTMLVPSLTLNLFLLIVALPLGSAFDRDSCFQKIQYLLGNQSLSPTSPFFFRDTFGGPPYNGVDNMTLTLDGCNNFCGPKQTWYTDIGPRLTIWLIPILLLLANVELSPLDKRNFLAVLHLLGDPIDSIWSLLHKIDAWDRCSALAARCNDACPSCQRVIASVFAGYEEVQGPRIESERYFETFLQQRNPATQFNEWRRAAVRLADSRTDELGRTVLAFLFYMFQLVCAFVPEVGGAPPGPPGGRIATGVLLSWLVPAILISNAVGNLPSSRTAYNIMADLAANTGDDTFHVVDQRSVFLPTFPSLAQACSTEYFRALGWSGAIYMYRPWKLRYVTSTRHRHLHTLLLATLAAAPVLIGLVGGVLILWYQLPVGPNCRHVWLVSVALLWNASAFITLITYGSGFATGTYHWRFTLIKDTCIAVPSLLAMFLSAVGLFNFCWCWSGPFQYPGEGRVPLPETMYIDNAKSVYPTIVGVTLLLQIIVVIVVAVVWRRGLQLLRWSEKMRRREWDRAMGRELCECKCNGDRSRQLSLESEMSLSVHTSHEALTLRSPIAHPGSPCSQGANV
jgi:hypothetical protein